MVIVPLLLMPNSPLEPTVINHDRRAYQSWRDAQARRNRGPRAVASRAGEAFSWRGKAHDGSSAALYEEGIRQGERTAEAGEGVGDHRVGVMDRLGLVRGESDDVCLIHLALAIRFQHNVISDSFFGAISVCFGFAPSLAPPNVSLRTCTHGSDHSSPIRRPDLDSMLSSGMQIRRLILMCLASQHVLSCAGVKC